MHPMLIESFMLLIIHVFPLFFSLKGTTDGGGFFNAEDVSVPIK